MTENSKHLFIRACFRQPVERTPVWIMRQAGRYLPQYQEIRRKYDFLTMYKTPELATEITLQPVEILGVDAAILFSDILVIPEAMGMQIQFLEGVGPHFSTPLRSEIQLDSLRPVEPYDQLDFVLKAIRLIRRELRERVPVIGFSGAPWTLATYMVSGGGSQNFQYIKQWRFAKPDMLHRLLKKISEAVTNYCRAQIESGAQAIQLFDTWAGMLDEAGFIEFVLPYIQKIIKDIRRPGVPVIYYAKGAAVWLEKLPDSGADVLSLDWTIDLGRARKILDNRAAVQGNLDPTALYAPPERIRQSVANMLQQFGRGNGHIANLGHGMLPDIPVEHARAFVNSVKEKSPVFHQNR